MHCVVCNLFFSDSIRRNCSIVCKSNENLCANDVFVITIQSEMNRNINEAKSIINLFQLIRLEKKLVRDDSKIVNSCWTSVRFSKPFHNLFEIDVMGWWQWNRILNFRRLNLVNLRINKWSLATCASIRI